MSCQRQQRSMHVCPDAIEITAIFPYLEVYWNWSMPIYVHVHVQPCPLPCVDLYFDDTQATCSFAAFGGSYARDVAHCSITEQICPIRNHPWAQKGNEGYWAT